MNSCMNCAYASWNKTASGKLHPGGEGRCKWQMPEILIPVCFHFYGFKRNEIPKPSGGSISRRNPHENCNAWEKLK